jgi:hypothetical protein
MKFTNNLAKDYLQSEKLNVYPMTQNVNRGLIQKLEHQKD